MPKQIQEIRATCQSCGNIWHYGKSDVWQNAANSMNNVGKDAACCSGCVPALAVKKKPVVDFNKCPKCGSRAISRQKVIHTV